MSMHVRLKRNKRMRSDKHLPVIQQIGYGLLSILFHCISNFKNSILALWINFLGKNSSAHRDVNSLAVMETVRVPV